MGRTGNAKAKKEQEDLLVSWKGPRIYEKLAKAKFGVDESDLDQLPFNNLRNPLDPTQSIRSFSFDEVQALSEKKHRGTYNPLTRQVHLFEHLQLDDDAADEALSPPAKRSSKGEPSTSLAKKPRVVDDPLGNPREHQLPDAAGKNPKGQDDDQASEKSGGEGDVPESSDGKSTGETIAWTVAQREFKLTNKHLGTIDHTSRAWGKRTQRFVKLDEVHQLAVRVHGAAKANQLLISARPLLA